MLTLFLNKFKELNNLQKGQILAAFFVIFLSISTTAVLVSNRQKQIEYQPKASSDTPDPQCSLIFDVQDEPTQVVTPTPLTTVPTTIPSIIPTLIPTSRPTLTPVPTTPIPSPTPAFSCQERCGTLIGRCGAPVSSTPTLTCSVSVTYPAGMTNDCTSICYCSYCPQPQKTPIPRPTLVVD